MVLSPQRMTIPRADPSTQFVEKNAMFFASSASPSNGSESLVCGSDSPVSDELSTFIDADLMIRKSAEEYFLVM